MNFSHVDDRLTVKEVKAAKRVFNWLFVELGIRENNFHIGTGRGGNNLQLVTLMSFTHTLVKRPIDIRVDDKRVAWSAEWLINTPRKQIRTRLDEVFEIIDEQHKYLAAALTELTKPNMTAAPTAEHRQHFPQLIQVLESKNYHLNPSLTMVEQLVLSCVMCHEMSLRLDKKDTSLVASVGKALQEFPDEIVLFSVRKYVQIERLINFNIDEHPDWDKMLSHISKVADAA